MFDSLCCLNLQNRSFEALWFCFCKVTTELKHLYYDYDNYCDNVPYACGATLRL